MMIRAYALGDIGDIKVHFLYPYIHPFKWIVTQEGYLLPSFFILGFRDKKLEGQVVYVHL